MDDPSDPAVAEEIMSRGSYTTWRNFYLPVNQYETDLLPNNTNIGSIYSLWIRLAGGQKYYMESNFGQGSGDLHWTVGVEINPDVAVPLTHNHLRPAR